MGVGARARNDAQSECKTDGKSKPFLELHFSYRTFEHVRACVRVCVGGCVLFTH